MTWKKNEPLPLFPDTQPPAAPSPKQGPSSSAREATQAPASNPAQPAPRWLAQPLPPQASTRRINGWLLLAVLVVGAGLGVGVHFLHDYQVRRNARALLYQADLAETENDPAKVIGYLSQFLVFEPRDNDARVRLAKALEQQAKTQRQVQNALLVYQDVIRRDPDRADAADLRKRTAELAIKIGRINLDLEQLTILLKDSPGDGNLERLAGECEMANKRFDEAKRLFESAIQHAPQEIGSYVSLADLERRHFERPRVADRVMDEMISANPRSGQAYLARARYFERLGQPDRAEADLAAARKLAPDDANVLLASARFAQGRDQADEARRYLEQGLERDPDNEAMILLLAGLEAQAGQLDKAIACLRRGLEGSPGAGLLRQFLANLLIQQGKLDEANTHIAKLEKDRAISKPQKQYLEASILASQRKWTEAARLLEGIQPTQDDRSELTALVNMLLGQCYTAMGDTERRLGAYRRVGAGSPLRNAAQIKVAEALADAGQTEAALTEYRKLLVSNPEVRVPMAKAMIAQMLALPPDQRRWSEIARFLAETAPLMPDDVMPSVLRAEVLAVQKKIPEAEQVIERARERYPDRPEPWVVLANLAVLRKQPQQALVLLEQAEKQLGPRVDFDLVRAGLALASGPEESRQILKQLEIGKDRYSKAEQARLLRGLANARRRLGEPAETTRLWELIAHLQPDDLGCRLVLFELAAQVGDDASMRRLTEDIRRIEGDNGLLWRTAQILRLVRKARKQPDQDALAEARTRLAELTDQRPDWPRLPLLRAELYETEKDTDRALENYLQAIKAGDKQVAVIRRAAQLLAERGRYKDANDLIRQLQDQTDLSGELARWAAVVSLRSQDQQRSLELARKSVAENSKDYREFLWLGQMLGTLGQNDEAEKALRKAVSLAEQEPETWVSLVYFLIISGQKQKIAPVIEEARLKLPPDKAPLTLAHCYAAAGQMQEADEQFKAALEAQPNNIAILRAVAFSHLGRNQPDQARPYLERVLLPRIDASAADKAWARSQLALVLAAQGYYHHLNDALALLDDNARTSEPSTEDQRTRALLLSAMPGGRKKAIDALEALLKRGNLDADGQLFLAQLHETNRDWPRAKERFLALLARHSDNPAYLVPAIRSFLSHQELDQAQTWLVRLDAVDPGSLAAQEARARLLKMKGKPQEAAALALGMAEGKNANLGRATRLLEELEEWADAEKLYRRWTAESKQPVDLLAFAGFLARRNRISEALDLCEKARPEAPEQAVAVAIAVLNAGKTDAAHIERVEHWLQEMGTKQPQAAWPLLFLADLRRLQQQFGEEEALCRKVLEMDRRNIAALNNLAWLLLKKEGNGTEAESLIQEAIRLGGPIPNLLDTRGMIRLALGQTDQAIKDLEDAATQSESANHSFHLAQAYLKAGNSRAAAESWKKAKAAGLTTDTVHPLERDVYTQVATRLDSR